MNRSGRRRAWFHGRGVLQPVDRRTVEHVRFRWVVLLWRRPILCVNVPLAKGRRFLNGTTAPTRHLC